MSARKGFSEVIMESSPEATLDGERNFLCVSSVTGSVYVAGEADRLQSETEIPPDFELPAAQAVQAMLDVFPIREGLHKILLAPVSEPKQPARLVTSTVRTEKLRGKFSITLPFFLCAGRLCFLPTAVLLFSCRLTATVSQSP